MIKLLVVIADIIWIRCRPGTVAPVDGIIRNHPIIWTAGQIILYSIQPPVLMYFITSVPVHTLLGVQTKCLEI